MSPINTLQRNLILSKGCFIVKGAFSPVAPHLNDVDIDNYRSTLKMEIHIMPNIRTRYIDIKSSQTPCLT